MSDEIEDEFGIKIHDVQTGTLSLQGDEIEDWGVDLSGKPGKLLLQGGASLEERILRRAILANL
ncbi:hypothetical protein AKJ65_04140 [candidate division MSBL1 archaeon SCGC-AAA259E19]|uniref:Uncharacterized protein n=1 Tax=candidate division MSBL1 archaeon SCGC-AAA259E19 TaxID=1698264 RepID=A0A133UK85_9EURY|nr:hypothetical protein AKJ65_04140 [candidate division MSBL1 archaeon SCGC-AAA259E19]